MRGVLTDIDDTLTTDGTLTMGAVAAIAALRAAGLPVIAVTGRPMGWSVPVVETTTLSAVVAENGAVALRADEDDGVAIEYFQDEAVRVAAGTSARMHAATSRRRATRPAASPTSRSTMPSSRTSMAPRSPRSSR